VLIGPGTAEGLDFEAIEATARREAVRIAARAVERRLNADHYDHGKAWLPCACGGCFKVSEAKTKDYVFGYTCSNDLSARDIQNREIEMARCKSYTTFAPIGPVIETELDPSNLKIGGYLNGEVGLGTTTANMIFGLPQQIAFISRIMRLLPGDVIITGACGVGEVKVGDIVEIEIKGIGRLSNHVIAEPL